MAFVRNVLAVVSGIALALTVLFVLAITSRIALPNDRASVVLTKAIAAGELVPEPASFEDQFTECSMLTMQLVRRDSALRDSLETMRVDPAGLQPCIVLRTTLEGGSANRPYSYLSYTYGSRFLEALALSVLDLSEAKVLYAMLSYGSVVVLLATSLLVVPGAAGLILPVCLALLLGFAQQHFGNNLAHAPGYFLGFLALAAFVGIPRVFTQLRFRLAFFGFLGTIAFAFDLLNGVGPVLLSLALVVNHFFYARRVLRPISEAFAIVASFVLAYLLLTVSRLGALYMIYGVDWHQYLNGLAERTGNAIPEYQNRQVSILEVAQQLWDYRLQLTPGGDGPATVFLVASAVAWVAAFILLSRPSRCDRPYRSFGVLTVAALIPLAWATLFAGHTFLHATFTPRLLTLPSAYGFVAVTVAWRSAHQQYRPGK